MITKGRSYGVDWRTGPKGDKGDTGATGPTGPEGSLASADAICNPALSNGGLANSWLVWTNLTGSTNGDLTILNDGIKALEDGVYWIHAYYKSNATSSGASTAIAGIGINATITPTYAGPQIQIASGWNLEAQVGVLVSLSADDLIYGFGWMSQASRGVSTASRLDAFRVA